MTRRHDIIARLIQVVQALGDLVDEFVFVGGSVVPLLVTDDAAPDARPTTDVDVVVEVLSRSEYLVIEQRLAKAGFRLDMMEEVICRFKNADLTLDVMPTDVDILTFGNRWYKRATSNPLTYTLLEKRTVQVINAPLFLCTKFDAYKDRGHVDEKDLEDIIAIVDGRRELFDELSASPQDVVKYVAESTSILLEDGLASRLNWFLPTDEAGAAREALVLNRLKAMAGLAGQ